MRGKCSVYRISNKVTGSKLGIKDMACLAAMSRADSIAASTNSRVFSFMRPA